MRVAIVNDVMISVEALRRVVFTDSAHQLAWVARDGAQAVERCAEDTPDLILMDLFMPVMNGVEATRRIMARSPCAILIVTATVHDYPAEVFRALGAGALDAVCTPVLASGATEGAAALRAKIDTLKRIIDPRGFRPTGSPQETLANQVLQPSQPLVVIGASAGGPSAVGTILSQLPADFPAPIIIVQHVDAQFASLMASWLDEHSSLHVRLAVDGDRPRRGEVLLAGTNDHLIFTAVRTLGYTADPREHSYRPSIDVFFESIVRYWSGQIVGVLLTGMGRDGAKGLKALRNAGMTTIAQDRATSVVYGMPKAAAELGAAVEILPLDKIAPSLVRLVSREPKHSSMRPHHG